MNHIIYIVFLMPSSLEDDLDPDARDYLSPDFYN